MGISRRRRKLLGVWLILAHLAHAVVMAVTNQVHVRFVPIADIAPFIRSLLSAQEEHIRIVRPRTLAVVRLMTSFKPGWLLTGVSPGFAPLTILSTCPFKPKFDFVGDCDPGTLVCRRRIRSFRALD